MNYGGGYEAYGNDDYGGGGFMDSASQGVGGSQGTPSKRGGGGGGGGRGSRDNQTLFPVTIKQLHGVQTSEDDVLRLDGQEVATVKVVGILSELAPQSTNVRFKLDDGTGVFDGQMFLHADEADYAENELAKLREGAYVRAVGKLRTFQERVSLSCFSVTPIEDFNEITHHFLDAVYVHLYNTRGPLQSATGAGGQQQLNTPVKQQQQGFNYNQQGQGFGMQQQGTWNQGGGAFGAGGGGALGYGGAAGSMDYGMDSSFSPEQKAILDVLATCTSDRGIKIDQIFMELRGQMNETQLRSALNYLTSEGHVYSTIDENHFKRTT